MWTSHTHTHTHTHTHPTNPETRSTNLEETVWIEVIVGDRMKHKLFSYGFQCEKTRKDMRAHTLKSPPASSLYSCICIHMASICRLWNKALCPFVREFFFPSKMVPFWVASLQGKKCPLCDRASNWKNCSKRPHRHARVYFLYFVVIVCTLSTPQMITLSLLRFCLCSCYLCFSVCMSSYLTACLPVSSRCRCSITASQSLSFFFLFYQTLLISLILRHCPFSHKLSLSRGINKFVRL
jgi:hypothetical protein